MVRVGKSYEMSHEQGMGPNIRSGSELTLAEGKSSTHFESRERDQIY